MTVGIRLLCLVSIVAVSLGANAPAAFAADPAAFFKNREIRVVVGQEAGATYDTYARAVARHMARHLPGNPILVITNMQGAGSIVALNHLYNVAPRDGSTIGAINPGAVSASILNPETARYDSRKFNWIGSVSRETAVIVVRSDAKAQSLKDAMTSEIVVGGTGGASSVLTTMLNGVLGTKFKVIEGYKGASEVYLAMERGEVDGIGSTTLTSLRATHSAMLETKKLRIIGQYGLSPLASLPDVPTVMDLVTNPEQRDALGLVLIRPEIGRALLAPPDVPADIVAAYRAAFDRTMIDPAFKEEVVARKMDLDPQSGAQLEPLIADLYRASPAIVEKVKGIMGGQPPG